ncbi:MAG TPA: alpha-ribazole phosphatase [Candidatus Hodarchaeales archaeon]|nr:alpha-ribazole phosphatase [Candidatus Hodarchaeales archaeon]
MEIFLIRHSRPDIESGICYGQSDVLLSKEFAEEFGWLHSHFPRVLDAVFTSPLSRCAVLAERIRAGEYFEDKRLLELNFGLWELKRWNEIDQIALDKWMKDYVNYQIPGGESFTSLHRRTNHFFDELISSNFRSVAIVTHAGVIRSLLVRVLDVPLANAFRIAVDYASLSKVIVNRSSRISHVSFLNLSKTLECGRDSYLQPK